MLSVLGDIGNSLGLDPRVFDAEMIAGVDILTGTLAQLDIAAADSQSTTNQSGERTSASSIGITPTSAGSKGALPIGVAISAAYEGRRFRARMLGITKVLVYGTYTRGSVVVSNLPTAAAGKRMLGYLLETGGVADTFSFATVWWNGLDGWGQVITTSGSEPEGPPDVPIENPEDVGGVGSGGGGGGGPTPDDTGSAGFAQGVQGIAIGIL